MTLIRDEDVEARLLAYAESVDVTKEPDDGFEDSSHRWRYTAHGAVSAGFRVIPLVAGTKVPAGQAWTQAATQDAATIAMWGAQQPPKWGMGLIPTVMMNGHRRVILDADTDTAYSFLRHHLGAPDVITAGRYSGSHKGGAHWYVSLRAPIVGLTSKTCGTYGIDAFGADGSEGHQAVGAGSYVTEYGAYYQPTNAVVTSRADIMYLIERRDTPLDELAPELYRWLRSVAKPPTPRATIERAEGSTENLDEWSRDTSWDSLLAADGWTRSGVDRCGCDTWQHPWCASTPRSVTAHVEGCVESRSNLPGGALRVWSSRVASILGWESASKLQYVTHIRYGGDYSEAREGEGIPSDRHSGGFDPADYM